MRKRSLVKLGFAVLVAVAALMGMGPARALALDCPGQFGACIYVSQSCDGYECCCYYFNPSHPGDACRDFCVGV